MAGWRTTLFALLILAVFILAYWIFQPSNDSAVSDADLVYCLAPAHQAGLVNAAVTLGLVGAGSSPAAVRVAKSVIPVGTWQARNSADFQRACDAYAAPALASGGSPAGGGGLGGVLNVLLPVAVGSLLTLTTDEIKQKSGQRRDQAEALRESWSAFRGVIETYVKERQRLPPDGVPAQSEIDALRRDLATKLRRIHSQYTSLPAVGGLRDQLTKELGAGIAAGWATGDSEEMIRRRGERADAVKGTLNAYDSSLRKAARELERGIWLPWGR